MATGHIPALAAGQHVQPQAQPGVQPAAAVVPPAAASASSFWQPQVQVQPQVSANLGPAGLQVSHLPLGTAVTAAPAAPAVPSTATALLSSGPLVTPLASAAAPPTPPGLTHFAAGAIPQAALTASSIPPAAGSPQSLQSPASLLEGISGAVAVGDEPVVPSGSSQGHHLSHYHQQQALAHTQQAFALPSPQQVGAAALSGSQLGPTPPVLAGVQTAHAATAASQLTYSAGVSATPSVGTAAQQAAASAQTATPQLLAPAVPQNTAAVQLMNAAAAAQQMQVERTVAQHAAASLYHAATGQAAAANTLQEHAQAAAAVQHAAAAYTAVASEAAAAASAAEQLRQAALVAAAGPQVVPLPACAHLVAPVPTPVPLQAAGTGPTAGTVPQLLTAVPGTVATAPAAVQAPAAAVVPVPSTSVTHATTPYYMSAHSVALGSSAGSAGSIQRHTGSTAASGLGQAQVSAAGPATPQLGPHMPHPGLLMPATQTSFAGSVVPGAADAAMAPARAPLVTSAVAPGLVPAAAIVAAAGVSPPAAHCSPSPSSAGGSSAPTPPQPASGAVQSPASSTFHSVSSWSQQASGLARNAKVVVSSGGSFAKQADSVWDYEGGETRLMALPFRCNLHTLMEALERAAGPLSSASGSAESASDAAPRTFAPQLKYRLPSDPGVWVDLVDDDDVAMMWDEWDEQRSGGTSSAKLHVYVQWRSPQDMSLTDSHDHQHYPSGPNTISDQQADASPRPHSQGAGSREGHKRAQHSHGAGQSTTSPTAGAHVQPRSSESAQGQGSRQLGQSASAARSVDLCALVEKMEIIPPSDIQLLRFLGSGGYGDVYLGRWHGVDVAVKSLSPSLFFGSGDVNSINRSAILDLIKEADVLGSMRHPNVVWVYGLVLPRIPTEEEEEEREEGELAISSEGSGVEEGSQCSRRSAATSRPRSDVVDAIAAELQQGDLGPGMVRPPALVAEYMAGGSLRSALARKADIVAGALTRVVLALDAAKGMEYLHSKRLVHFDLKSANLLLGYRDRRPVCKVADFGLSKQKLQTYVSGVSSQRGTLPWTAPEILRTPEAVTEKIDVFSFGVVMWELWTGQEPHAGLNYHALMMRLANPREQLRPPVPGNLDWEGDVPGELAPGWRELMERCWAEDPADRPPFNEIIQELRRMASQLKPRREGSARSSHTPSQGKAQQQAALSAPGGGGRPSGGSDTS